MSLDPKARNAWEGWKGNQQLLTQKRIPEEDIGKKSKERSI